jgi:hypothetical protein
MWGALAWLHVALGSIALLGIVAMPAKAHHGGLGIEGDIITWSLKVAVFALQRRLLPDVMPF